MRKNGSPTNTRRSSAARVSGAGARESGADVEKGGAVTKNLLVDEETMKKAAVLQTRLGIKGFSGLVRHLIVKATIHGIPGEPPMVQSEG